MTMLAEVVDAVIGIDTHRDSHEAEIADAAGRPVARLRISNDSAGFAQLLDAIAELAPGPRVAVSVEGSRGYGVGLARVLAAAGLQVTECEQPSRRQRRGKGKQGGRWLGKLIREPVGGAWRGGLVAGRRSVIAGCGHRLSQGFC